MMNTNNKSRIIFLLAIMTVTIRAQDQPTPQWRPVYHFTAEKNWINDPNGLIYVNGVYHMYYQYNPYANVWGNMSWGHAVSQDLMHWQHLPVAISKKDDGNVTTMIFSGSAVWDQKNLTGFGTTAEGPLVAIYTADQLPRKSGSFPEKQSQFLAYSNDGGLTYDNYESNPVLDIHRNDFRDPNVFWFEEQGHWLMTVAVASLKKVQFYKSIDLKKWEFLSEFSEGDRRKIWECSSLTMHFVDDDPSKRKWLLMISSGNPQADTGMQYFIGDFNGTNFINDNPADTMLFVDYGKTFYAAIPYNNLPYKQSMMIGWLAPYAYDTPTWPWRGQMSIPRDLHLKSTPEGVRLYQQPAALLQESLDKLPASAKLSKENFTINSNRMPLALNGNAWWIEAEFLARTAQKFGFRICNETIEIGYDANKRELNVATEKISVKLGQGKVNLQALFDKSSLEVFVNGGKMVVTTLVFPNKDVDGVSLFAEQGKVQVNMLKVWDLSGEKSLF